MPPARDRAADCAVHEERLDNLDEQVKGLRDKQVVMGDSVAAIRTDVAVTRTQVEGITKRLDSAMPTMAQVVLMLLTVASTALATYLITHPPGVPAAHAAQE